MLARHCAASLASSLSLVLSSNQIPKLRFNIRGDVTAKPKVFELDIGIGIIVLALLRCLGLPHSEVAATVSITVIGHRSCQSFCLSSGAASG
jgi:hypothetical protein